MLQKLFVFSTFVFTAKIEFMGGLNRRIDHIPSEIAY
jgi:hypothetical protein